MMDDPLITIITPCLNRAEFVSEAIDSVLNQDYRNVEHIIVDGGSTDGTLDILKSYPHLIVISEPDRGLYDAINKGIKLANGEIIGFLNTDDFYEPNIFQRIIQAFSEQPTASAVVGAASIFVDHPNGSREILEVHPTIAENDLFYRSTIGNPIFNAWFFRRNLFNIIGGFNSKYKYVADRDFLIRMDLRKQKYFSIPEVLYHYRSHPDSLTFAIGDMGESELTAEFLHLNEFYIDQLKNDSNHKKIITYLHSELTSDQFISALKNQSPQRAIIYAKSGFEYDHYWPIRLFRRTLHRLIAAINRRI